jgi:hypothetical protein
MKLFIYPIVIVITIILALTVSVFWADWIVKELFNKDINNWVILVGVIVTSLFIPRALSGILSLAMVVASFYILFIR